MLTIGLVVMVIFLFLRNLAATIIPSVAVPLSLVGTFGVMYLLGYSLNNLTLMALTISTGFVVDDAIVMIENIIALHRAGRKAAGRRAQRLRADRLHHHFADRFADRGADSAAVHGRYRGPPVPRIRGDAERDHHRESAVVSLTLTPMMCAKLLKHKDDQKQGRLFRASETAFEQDHRVYGRTLKVVLRFQTITLLVALATLVLTILLYIYIPKGFFPIQDTGVIQGVSEASADHFLRGDVPTASSRSRK